MKTQAQQYEEVRAAARAQDAAIKAMKAAQAKLDANPTAAERAEALVALRAAFAAVK